MKKTLTAVLTLALIASMSVSVFAADSTSNASVTFTSGGVNVVDPSNPGGVEVPETGGYGDLGSQNIVFDETTITGGAQSIPSTPDGTNPDKGPVGVAVNDASGQADYRWTVTVKMSDFVQTADNSKILAGYTVDLTPVAGSVVGPAGTTSGTPTASTVSAMGANETAKTIFAANTATGSAGLWGGNWEPILNITAGSAEAQSYESTITWTVNNPA